MPAAGQSFDGYGQAPVLLSECAGPVRASGDVVVLSMYGGRGVAVPLNVEGAEHDVRAVSVTGNGSKPITLVLSAYEATIWDLSAIKGRVRGVIASGFYPQAVSGLPAGVPVQFESIRPAANVANGGGGRSPCNLGYVHESMYKIQQQADQIKGILGVAPKRWYGGYDPSGFNVDGGEATAPVVPTGTIRAGVTIQRDGLRGGNEGIEQMISEGKLRRIGRADIDAWVTKGGRLQITGTMARMFTGGGHDPLDYIGSSSSGYLILKSVDKLPGGLGGADAVIFIVPDGVSAPTEAGHSTFYRLTGYLGIPPAGAPVPPDSRMQMIERSNSTNQAAPTQIEWDAEGRVTRNDSRTRTLGGAPPALTATPYEIRNPSARGTAPAAGAQNTVEMPGPHDSGRNRAVAISVLMLLLLAGGGAFWLLMRRRSANARPAFHLGSTSPGPLPPMVQPASKSVRAAAEPAQPETPCGPDDWTTFSTSVQSAISATEDDATVLSVTRFSKRVRQLTQNEYDEDLCALLDAIVEDEFPRCVTGFVSAARRGTAEALPMLEEGLRNAMTEFQRRLDAIADTQTTRDVAKLRTGYGDGSATG